ncbi:hypothetical protein J31TS4_07060 [Paenibacillus sp. J31TS4]|uniref:cell wall elongation regulator TseB-like domain-containing protein n=1 Tax=Paenibacillus sp. J31TS4 TaxID=2807195 RepID=UPI001B2EB318|nr:DUF5590 domain-containing protein [Paenibacillus sp. J31TS4]GIP37426.1 hypothetical protein J31TS4_07060 [Paenibacillus sp. J31TS4]
MRVLTRKRVGWTLSVIAAACLVFVFRYYTVIQAEEEAVLNQAAERARQAGHVTTVTKLQPYTGDEPYTVVFGKNAEDQEVIVWVSEGEMIAKPASEGVTSQMAQTATKAKGADVEVLRVSAGRTGGVLVWEVFYKRPEAGGERYYYDFYHFEDGSPIDTYKLSVR